MSNALIMSLIAVVIGIPAATYYPFMFLRIKWFESDIGKSMMTKGLALAAVFWVAILSVPAWHYHWAWFEWVKASVNIFLAIAVWIQVLVMRNVQRSGELEHRMKRSGDEQQAVQDSGE